MTMKPATDPAYEMPAQWTLATIFRNPEKDPDGSMWARIPPGNTTSRFTSEFLAATEKESSEGHWERIEDEPPIPSEMSERVGLSKEKCPNCVREEVRLLHRGGLTKILMYRRVPCSCERLKRFWSYWGKVPERLRGANLATIVPRGTDKISAARQAKILYALKERPEGSYLFWGPPGTGKSYFAAALYRHACNLTTGRQLETNDWCTSGPIWRVETSTLLAEHAEWASRNKYDEDCRVPAPTVTKQGIELYIAKGHRPCLYLEEIDKVAFTEARINKLCELVNAVYEAKGQVVATCNKSEAFLTQKWGADEAGTLLRRIGGDGGYSVRFED